MQGQFYGNLPLNYNDAMKMSYLKAQHQISSMTLFYAENIMSQSMFMGQQFLIFGLKAGTVII